MQKLSRMGGRPVLRMAVKKAGPVVTDNSNFVVDCDFDNMTSPSELNLRVCIIIRPTCSNHEALTQTVLL
jgi:ribose 5-phosphate isomerase A